MTRIFFSVFHLDCPFFRCLSRLAPLFFNSPLFLLRASPSSKYLPCLCEPWTLLFIKYLFPFLSQIFLSTTISRVKEETFWRNYFYRVSLLKQSTQANSLNKSGACRTGSTSSSEAEGPDEVSPSTEQPQFIAAQDSFRQDSVTSSKGVRRFDSKTDGKKTNGRVFRQP